MPAILGLIFLVIFLSLNFFTAAKQTSSVSSGLLTVFQHAIPQRRLNDLPKIQARSAIVLDQASGFRLLDLEADKQQPIASLTKLMTALVFLDHNPGWDKNITVTKEDLRSGAKANIFPGDNIIVSDLFKAALIASDNSGMTVLVRSTGLSEAEFVQAMNSKASELRIRGINFSDPTGLDANNKGSALAVAKLAAAAFAKPEIAEALQNSNYSFAVAKSLKREVKSTNELLGKMLPTGAILVGGKTGHLEEAGYCFVGVFDYQGHRFITAVLGAGLDEERFSETLKILDWTMRAYLWEN